MAAPATNSSSPVSSFADDFVSFLNEAWTNFHAVRECSKMLIEARFIKLDYSEKWDLLPGGNYFYTRNCTSLVAFSVGAKYSPGEGAVIIGAHTDSPCPKLKPRTGLGGKDVPKQGYISLGIQPYGGGLWHTWFDRDLGLAGRVVVNRSASNNPPTNGERMVSSQELVRINKPILRIPNLAIHLTKGDERTKFAPNLHSHLAPILATAAESILQCTPPSSSSSSSSLSSSLSSPPLLLRLLAAELGCSAVDIVDAELQLCDTQPSVVGGALNEFVFGGRLDNLCSSYQATRALIDTLPTVGDETKVRMVFLFDHEEIGSTSAQGAGSSMLMEGLRRIQYNLYAHAHAHAGRGCSTTPSPGPTPADCEDFWPRSLRRSFIVSADMAHGLHPNYPDRHDTTEGEIHAPSIGSLNAAAVAPAPAPAPGRTNGGIVLKYHANQRYATDMVGAVLFRKCAEIYNATAGAMAASGGDKVSGGNKAMAAAPSSSSSSSSSSPFLLPPIQSFCVRADSGCGSTIGPMTSALSGVRTIDIGSPQLSMHSCREMMGCYDLYVGYLHMVSTFNHYKDAEKEISTHLDH